MRLLPYTMLLLAGLSLLGCSGKKTDQADTDTTTQTSPRSLSNAAPPEEDTRVVVLDRLVETLEDRNLTIRSMKPFSYREASGTLEGLYQGEVLQIARTTLTSRDGRRTIYEWIYVDETGKPLLYREIIVFARCSPQQPAPCVQETRIYLDETARQIAAKQRNRVMEDAADNSLEGIPFEDFTPESDMDTKIITASIRYRETLRNLETAARKPNAPEIAQPDGERIYFNGEATLLKGSLQGVPSKEYMLWLRETQMATIRLESSAGCVMRVVDTRGTVLMNAGTEWAGTATATGDLRVRISCSSGNATYKIAVSSY